MMMTRRQPHGVRCRVCVLSLSTRVRDHLASLRAPVCPYTLSRSKSEALQIANPPSRGKSHCAEKSDSQCLPSIHTYRPLCRCCASYSEHHSSFTALYSVYDFIYDHLSKPYRFTAAGSVRRSTTFVRFTAVRTGRPLSVAVARSTWAAGRRMMVSQSWGRRPKDWERRRLPLEVAVRGREPG